MNEGSVSSLMAHWLNGRWSNIFDKESEGRSSAFTDGIKAKIEAKIQYDKYDCTFNEI